MAAARGAAATVAAARGAMMAEAVARWVALAVRPGARGVRSDLACAAGAAKAVEAKAAAA